MTKGFSVREARRTKLTATAAKRQLPSARKSPVTEAPEPSRITRTAPTVHIARLPTVFEWKRSPKNRAPKTGTKSGYMLERREARPGPVNAMAA